MSQAVNFPNQSTRFLCGIIFNKKNVSLLKSFGLVATFVDDYGYRSKYQDCLFFLFKSDTHYFAEFEKRVVDFESFFDWYDVNDKLRMYVFKVDSTYRKDLDNFKGNRLNEMSELFYEVQNTPVILANIDVDLSKEIYRFEAVNP
jgi:hypothetical protein